MNTENNSGTDLLALFAEIEAYDAAHPEELAASIAAYDAERAVEAQYAADEAGRKLLADIKARCRKCSGYGNLPQYHHINGGVCFDCGGSGKG